MIIFFKFLNSDSKEKSKIFDDIYARSENFYKRMNWDMKCADGKEDRSLIKKKSAIFIHYFILIPISKFIFKLSLLPSRIFFAKSNKNTILPHN